MANFLIKMLQSYAAEQRRLSMTRCNDWAGENALALKPTSILDVGCGDGNVLLSYFKTPPPELYGVEGAPDYIAAAQKRDFKISDFDLNGRWPYESNKFDVVFSSQVIEHLHNTRLYVEETFRVLKPGGTAIVTTENLCSLLNWFAMTLGYTPFSVMQTCGRYLGNPLGLHYNEPLREVVPIDHPSFAGITGHVRVMTVRQAKEVFEWAGFETDARSIGILPLPDSLSKMLESFVIHRGHFLVIKARKPLAQPSAKK